MKRKVLALFILTTMILSLVACGKQEDTGIVIQVGDNSNDSSKNDLTGETNDVQDSTENSGDNTPVVSDDEYMRYITGGFSADNGDVFKFKVDGTYSHYIVASGTTESGTYTTDGKTYITLKCTLNNSVNNDTKEEESETTKVEVENPSTEPVAYKTAEPSEDGKSTLITEYDAQGNIVNKYIINKEYSVEEDTGSNNDKKDEVLSEIKYKLSKTTMNDDYNNVIEVVILSKDDAKIILQKKFDLN